MRITIDSSTKHRDNRGFLVDFLKLSEVETKDSKLGQIYFVTFDNKGVIRGNHYHKTKKEWFVAVKGKLKVFLKDLETNMTKELILEGDSNNYQRIWIDKNIAHAFMSLTKSAAMINYSNKPYHKEDPDTIQHKLI